MKTNNFFSDSELRGAMRVLFEDLPDDRFLLSKFDRKRKGDISVCLGEDSQLGFNFELNSSGRTRDIYETGRFISLKIGSITQKVFLDLSNQNATYSDIAERLGSFMLIED